MSLTTKHYLVAMVTDNKLPSDCQSGPFSPGAPGHCPTCGGGTHWSQQGRQGMEHTADSQARENGLAQYPGFSMHLHYHCRLQGLPLIVSACPLHYHCRLQGLPLIVSARPLYYHCRLQGLPLITSARPLQITGASSNH